MPEFEPELEPVEDYMAARGIESFADRMVRGHDGRQVALAEALAICEPARNLIDAYIETIRDLAGDDVDILPHFERYVDRMGEEAQSTPLTPETQGAGKK